MDSGEQYELEADRHLQAWRARDRPDNEIPVAVPLGVIIGRTENAVAFIASASVYSNGVEFAIEVRSRGTSIASGGDDPFDRWRSFSFALEYADGRRYVRGRSSPGSPPEPADVIHLRERGGSASANESTTEFYLTPVPAPAHLYIYFEWPLLGIPKTKTRVATQSLADAASRVQQLWPVAGRETQQVQRPAARTSEVNAGLLKQLFESEVTPLIRTDFTDDAAWATVIRRLTRPVDFEDPDSIGFPSEEPDLDDITPDHDDPELDRAYTPHVELIDNRANEGITADHLAELFPLDDTRYGYVLLADARSMAEASGGGELTVVYVDLSWDREFDDQALPGRSFRVVDTEFASIEANLSIANLDFEDFAEAVDPDGVFRGFGGH